MNLKTEIITTTKEQLAKKILEKNNEDLKELDRLKAKKKKLRDRKLHVKSVSLDLPKEQSITLGLKTGKMTITPVETKNNVKLKELGASAADVDGGSDPTDNLLQTMQVQAKSINSIMKSLKGLAEFKNSIKDQIQSISQNVSQIKGDVVGVVDML